MIDSLWHHAERSRVRLYLRKIVLAYAKKNCVGVHTVDLLGQYSNTYICRKKITLADAYNEVNKWQLTHVSIIRRGTE